MVVEKLVIVVVRGGQDRGTALMTVFVTKLPWVVRNALLQRFLVIGRGNLAIIRVDGGVYGGEVMRQEGRAVVARLVRWQHARRGWAEEIWE